MAMDEFDSSNLGLKDGINEHSKSRSHDNSNSNNNNNARDGSILNLHRTNETNTSDNQTNASEIITNDSIPNEYNDNSNTNETINNDTMDLKGDFVAPEDLNSDHAAPSNNINVNPIGNEKKNEKNNIASDRDRDSDNDDKFEANTKMVRNYWV